MPHADARIVETTGERIGGGRVVWRFDAGDAFPLGYDMTVRSLAPNAAAQKAVLGTIRLDTLAETAEYAALLRSDSGLAETMRRCVEAGSLTPLDDYEAELANQDGVEPAFRARIVALKRLIAP